MEEYNIYQNEFKLTNKSCLEQQTNPNQTEEEQKEEKEKKDLKLLYQVTGNNLKLSNIKKDIGIFLELTDYIFNDIKSISEAGKSIKNMKYSNNSNQKINKQNLYSSKLKCFKNSLSLFQKKYNIIKDNNNNFKKIFEFIKHIKHFGFYLDEKNDINENDMILDIDKIIIHNKLITNFDDLINIKNKNFKIIHVTGAGTGNNINNINNYRLQSDFYDYYNNKYDLIFKMEINIDRPREKEINIEKSDNQINDLIINDLINFYKKYLLYKFFKEETNAFRNYLNKETKEIKFINRGLTFTINKYVNTISIKCNYFDNLEINFSIIKKEKEQYKKPINIYPENKQNNNDRYEYIINKFLVIFIKNILFDIKKMKNITNFIGQVKKSNNLTLEKIIKNSIFVKNITNLGLILLKNEVNYLVSKGNYIYSFFLNIFETPLGKYKLLFEYYEKGMKIYYLVDLVFDDNLNLTIILKDSYKNCIFNLDQGQIIYIEKGRINFHYLQDILINTIKNYYFIRNNEKLASKASIV